MIINGIFNGLYLRGVIPIRKFYQTRNSIIWPAVDEAADWYTNTEWIGVSAAPTAHFILEKFGETGGEADQITNFFIKYDVPTKVNSTEKMWVVNWPKLYKDFPTQRDGMTVKALILNRFADRAVSVSAFPKFSNTLKFVDYVMRST